MEQNDFKSLLIDINKKDYYGKTALHRAVECNDVPLVKKLLLQGVKINAKDISKKTPLHFAASENRGVSHYEVTELLLNSGADINATDYSGKTPIWFLVEDAVNKVELKMVELFLKFKADVSKQKDLVVQAIGRYNENVEILQLLIDHGMDVNYRDEWNSSLLHMARFDRNMKVLKCLLKNGANMNVADSNGQTPLTEKDFDDDSGEWFVYDSDEESKKELNFILEHMDFNIYDHFNESENDLTYACRDYFHKIIVEHFAKLQALELPVHQNFLNSALNPGYGNQDYYEQCQKELIQAKKTKIKNSWITYFDILIADKKKLKNYAGNQDLIEDYEKKDFAVKFRIYGSSIDKIVKKGIKTRRLFDESAIVLSDCLPIFKPSHLVIRDILDCILSKKDFSKLCEQKSQ